MATEAVRRIPKVFDKYMLPKVAFTLVTTASIAGAILTGWRHGWTDWSVLALRWSAYYMVALLLGTEIWKIFYLRPSVKLRPVPEALLYGDAMLRLHRRWQKALVPLALMLAGGHLANYGLGRPGALPWAVAGGIALIVGLAAAVAGWSRPVESQQQEHTSCITLIGLAATTALFAAMDVALQPANTGSLWLHLPNRVLHIWAFSAWLGGALWNIFIAVPAGRERENMDTVILANFQLERFRVVVRTVFPTIVLTGLVQAWGIFRFDWSTLWTTTWGWLALTKVGLILGLVGVFIACPMWGACSPIRGVCNLDDLYNQEDEA